MKQENHSTPGRKEIRKIFRANRGIQSKIARDLGLKPNTLSMWLSGKSPSRRLDTEVPRIIRELGLLNDAA